MKASRENIRGGLGVLSRAQEVRLQYRVFPVTLDSLNQSHTSKPEREGKRDQERDTHPQRAETLSESRQTARAASVPSWPSDKQHMPIPVAAELRELQSTWQPQTPALLWDGHRGRCRWQRRPTFTILVWVNFHILCPK